MKLMRSWFRAACIAVAALAATSAAAGATDENLLVVEAKGGQQLASFTFEQLKGGFTQHDMITATPFIKNGVKIHFRGPALSDFIAKAGLQEDQTIEVAAYDGFIAYVKMEEIRAYNPIIALEVACSDRDAELKVPCSGSDGFRPLVLKEGGPFYLMWPLEEMPASYNPTRNSIWVWCVTNIRPDRK